jgi:histone demethylase JARID1
MILCDYCNGGYHTYCLDPPLTAVPTGDWFCAECTKTDSSDTSFGFKEGFEHSLESVGSWHARRYTANACS